MNISGECVSADVKAAEEFWETLDQPMVEECYLPEQVLCVNPVPNPGTGCLRGLSPIRRPNQRQA